MDIKTLSIRPVEWIKCGMTVNDGSDFFGSFCKCVVKFAGDKRHFWSYKKRVDAVKICD